MTSFAKLLAVLGLLIVIALAAEEQNFSRKYLEYFGPFDTRLAQNVNQSLTYMVCGWTKGWATYNCYIQLNLVDGFEKYCKLTLPHLKKHDHLYSMITNKALVEWTFVKYGMEYKRLTLYDINNCNSIDIDFPFDHHYHLLVYDNSFHVSVKSMEKCGEEHNPCTIRYNNDGEQIGEPVPFPPKYYRQGYAMVVDRHNSSSGGFFTTYEKIKGHEYQMNVSHVSNDGTEMVLLKNYVVRKNVEGAQVQSNEYGYFSFCHRQFELRGVITCTQYDAMGKLIIDGWFYLTWGQKMIKLFNLRRGGMILMYFKCSSLRSFTTDVKIIAMTHKKNSLKNVQLTEVGIYTYPGKEGQGYSIEHMETDTQHCFYFANGPHRWYDKKTVIRFIKKCINKTV